jgi:hypothetical protein
VPLELTLTCTVRTSNVVSLIRILIAAQVFKRTMNMTAEEEFMTKILTDEPKDLAGYQMAWDRLRKFVDETFIPEPVRPCRENALEAVSLYL